MESPSSAAASSTATTLMRLCCLRLMREQNRQGSRDRAGGREGYRDTNSHHCHLLPPAHSLDFLLAHGLEKRASLPGHRLSVSTPQLSPVLPKSSSATSLLLPLPRGFSLPLPSSSEAGREESLSFSLLLFSPLLLSPLFFSRRTERQAFLTH